MIVPAAFAHEQGLEGVRKMLRPASIVYRSVIDGVSSGVVISGFVPCPLASIGTQTRVYVVLHLSYLAAGRKSEIRVAFTTVQCMRGNATRKVKSTWENLTNKSLQ